MCDHAITQINRQLEHAGAGHRRGSEFVNATISRTAVIEASLQLAAAQI